MSQENKQPQLSDYVGMRFKDFRAFDDELGDTFVVVVFEDDTEMLIKLSGEEEEYSYKDKYIDLYYVLRMFDMELLLLFIGLCLWFLLLA